LRWPSALVRVYDAPPRRAAAARPGGARAASCRRADQDADQDNQDVFELYRVTPKTLGIATPNGTLATGGDVIVGN
jgi:hypothetical protein